MKATLILVLLLLLTPLSFAKTSTQTAVFAGGCFWCMQPPFDKTNGVLKTTVGYAGGFVQNPTYKQVVTGTTGHVEAIEIVFNPNKVSFADLLEIYWLQIDPTDNGGQFADRGASYRPIIFYKNEEQKQVAQKSKANLNQINLYNEPIVVDILPYKNFFAAEDNHQKYYKKNPIHYNLYKEGSGRQSFIGRTCELRKAKGLSLPDDLKNK